MKIAHNLIALAFEIGCVGLWLVMKTMEMLHRAHPFPLHNAGGGNLAPSDLEVFCFGHSTWLPYLGLPAVAYALVASLRGKTSLQSFCIFAALLALLFMVLFFTVSVSSLASWIPVYG